MTFIFHKNNTIFIGELADNMSRWTQKTSRQSPGVATSDQADSLYISSGWIETKECYVDNNMSKC